MYEYVQYIPSNKLARAKSTCYQKYIHLNIIKLPVQSLFYTQLLKICPVSNIYQPAKERDYIYPTLSLYILLIMSEIKCSFIFSMKTYHSFLLYCVCSYSSISFWVVSLFLLILISSLLKKLAI